MNTHLTIFQHLLKKTSCVSLQPSFLLQMSLFLSTLLLLLNSNYLLFLLPWPLSKIFHPILHSKMHMYYSIIALCQSNAFLNAADTASDTSSHTPQNQSHSGPPVVSATAAIVPLVVIAAPHHASSTPHFFCNCFYYYFFICIYFGF